MDTRLAESLRRMAEAPLRDHDGFAASTANYRNTSLQSLIERTIGPPQSAGARGAGVSHFSEHGRVAA